MIDLVYKILEFWINKKQEGGLPSPSEYNSLARLAQINVINNHVKPKGFELYQWDGDEISSIKSEAALTKTDGSFVKPSDLMYLMGLYFKSEDGSEHDIDLLREFEYRTRANSKLVAPDLEYPIAKWEKGGYKVLPTSIANEKVVAVYVKLPENPEWAFTLDGNGMEVYDEGNSTDFELPISMANEVALEVFKQMGFNVGDKELAMITEQFAANE